MFIVVNYQYNLSQVCLCICSFIFINKQSHCEVLHKMATSKVEKAYCALEFARTGAVVTVQRNFTRRFNKPAPHRNCISRWVRQLQETGCLCPKKSPGRPQTSAETVNRIQAAYVRSPKKSTRRASNELQIPQTTVWRILRKRLHFKPYKLQFLQSLKPEDMPKRRDFCIALQDRLGEDEFADRLVFSDEATFHLSGKVNRHNVRIWGTENPRVIVEHVRDSPKCNVFCALSNSKVYGPFFFAEATVNGHSYLSMLTEWLMPQIVEDVPNFVFQQDGAPPHFHNDVREYLDENLPHRWIGRAANNLPMLQWPPRSPDLTPCDFFLWGYIKDSVYVPPLPADMNDLRRRITAAVDSINRNMLARVWTELEYRLDICRVTNGAHIEHL